MASDEKGLKASAIECCPELVSEPICDTIDVRYRLPFRTRMEDSRQVVPVEVILHFVFRRCSGSLVIGDPIYSISLLPQERVRLFTSDRHARWSYDAESGLSYRHETTSEESFLTAGMARALSDLTITSSGSSVSTFEESWAEGGGSASFSIPLIGSIGGGGGGGFYDAESTASFAQSFSRHAESASAYVAAGVRAKSTTAIGEVQRRSHAEGESEAHYESSSRLFVNPNRCHSVTYLFRKINKVQEISFNLEAIERRIVDPAAPTIAIQREPEDISGGVRLLPAAILATSKDRLEVLQRARKSVSELQSETPSRFGGRRVTTPASSESHSSVMDPIHIGLRQDALDLVDRELMEHGLLADPETDSPTDRFRTKLSWERREILPTPGIIVKGCLDECNTCSAELQREIEIELERKQLENQMFARQIELLESAQEYRCCPGGTDEENE
ncbi:hypothetical protein ACFL41_01815 [Gemmatimonadota bacterium]